MGPQGLGEVLADVDLVWGTWVLRLYQDNKWRGLEGAMQDAPNFIMREWAGCSLQGYFRCQVLVYGL